MPDSAIVYEDPTLRIAVVRNLLINVWSDAPTVAQMRAFGSAARTLERARPRSSGLLNAVVSGTPRFSDGVRDEAVRLTREKMLPLGVAHLIVVGGLAGAATRAFFSTIMLLGRPRIPTRVWADPRASCEWLAALLSVNGESWTASEMVAAYEEAARR